MTSLTGYMPSSAENRFHEWYGGTGAASSSSRRLEECNTFYPSSGAAAFNPYGRSENNLMARATQGNSNTYVSQGFFDCLDSVDETQLAYMISELGLYYLQELPDLRLIFARGSAGNRTKSRREGAQIRMARQ